MSLASPLNPIQNNAIVHFFCSATRTYEWDWLLICDTLEIEGIFTQGWNVTIATIVMGVTDLKLLHQEEKLCRAWM